MKYLLIPATSVNFEKCFSPAGNVESPKRNGLAPENVNLIVFLYQNHQIHTMYKIVNKMYVFLIIIFYSIVF